MYSKAIVVLAILAFVSVAVGAKQLPEPFATWFNQKTSDSDDCKTCQDAVQHIQELFKDDSFVIILRIEVTGFCQYLINPSYVDRCKRKVGAAYDKLIKGLREDTPYQVCVKFSHCGKY